MTKKLPKPLNMAEETFAVHLRVMGIHMEREGKFHPKREWRADFINRSHMIIVEIDGGNRLASIGRDGKPFAVGRHTQESDYQKLNAAALLGYRVFRFTPAMVKSGDAIEVMIHAFKKGGKDVS